MSWIFDLAKSPRMASFAFKVDGMVQQGGFV
jgi:hypothetical protein